MKRRYWAIIWGGSGGLLTAAVLMALVYYPSHLLVEYFVGMAGVLVFAGCGLGRGFRRHWPNIFLGAVIVTGNFSFVLLLAGTPLRWAMMALAVAMSGLWCWNLSREKTNGGLNRGLGLVALFFIAYGLDTIGGFFMLEQWQLLAGLFVLVLMVSGPALAVLGEISSRVWLYSLVISLGLVQLWWCLEFWPTTLLTNSLVVVAAAYFLISIASRDLVGSLDAKKTWQYGLMSALIILLALLTSPWFLTA